MSGLFKICVSLDGINEDLVILRNPLQAVREVLILRLFIQLLCLMVVLMNCGSDI